MKQLLANNSIRRVAMCALASVKGKRQHLCVNHDKGKVREEREEGGRGRREGEEGEKGGRRRREGRRERKAKER